jgi:hypothetical protein
MTEKLSRVEKKTKIIRTKKFIGAKLSQFHSDFPLSVADVKRTSHFS